MDDKKTTRILVNTAINLNSMRKNTVKNSETPYGNLNKIQRKNTNKKHNLK